MMVNNMLALGIIFVIIGLYSTKLAEKAIRMGDFIGFFALIACITFLIAGLYCVKLM